MANIIKSINFGYMRGSMLCDAARMAAVESKKFFRQSFRNGGFTDAALVKWRGSNNPFRRKMMFGVGTLMGSIRTEEGAMRVVVSSNTAYSAIHNDGGTITVTAQMKRFWWARYIEFSGKTKKTKKGKVSRAKANQKISAKAEFCKRMALMKVGSKIKIPKRQFMGESKTLMNNLDKKLHIKIAEYWEKA
ncbi:MAG: hypothetical protein LBB41_00905 [Prevotellaceae bacterium]|jgi:phage gpG-like protein|nr:hypothetical protein [Prevotellaceae bacterium]